MTHRRLCYTSAPNNIEYEQKLIELMIQFFVNLFPVGAFIGASIVSDEYTQPNILYLDSQTTLNTYGTEDRKMQKQYPYIKFKFQKTHNNKEEVGLEQNLSFYQSLPHGIYPHLNNLFPMILQDSKECTLYMNSYYQKTNISIDITTSGKRELLEFANLIDTFVKEKGMFDIVQELQYSNDENLNVKIQHILGEAKTHVLQVPAELPGDLISIYKNTRYVKELIAINNESNPEVREKMKKELDEIFMQNLNISAMNTRYSRSDEGKYLVKLPPLLQFKIESVSYTDIEQIGLVNDTGHINFECWMRFSKPVNFLLSTPLIINGEMIPEEFVYGYNRRTSDEINRQRTVKFMNYRSEERYNWYTNTEMFDKVISLCDIVLDEKNESNGVSSFSLFEDPKDHLFVNGYYADALFYAKGYDPVRLLQEMRISLHKGRFFLRPGVDFILTDDFQVQILNPDYKTTYELTLLVNKNYMTMLYKHFKAYGEMFRMRKRLETKIF